MNITSFKVSQDKSRLELALLDASTANVLHLWTHKTYKTEGLQIDLSAKLTGGANPVIYITPEDINLTSFDGVYFIDVKSPTETLCAIAAELTRYKECIVEKVLAKKGCDGCLEVHDVPTLNAHVTFQSLLLSLELAIPQEILLHIHVLDKFCTNDCRGCGEHKII